MLRSVYTSAQVTTTTHFEHILVSEANPVTNALQEIRHRLASIHILVTQLLQCLLVADGLLPYSFRHWLAMG